MEIGTDVKIWDWENKTIRRIGVEVIRRDKGESCMLRQGENGLEEAMRDVANPCMNFVFNTTKLLYLRQFTPLDG